MMEGSTSQQGYETRMIDDRRNSSVVASRLAVHTPSWRLKELGKDGKLQGQEGGVGGEEGQVQAGVQRREQRRCRNVGNRH